jgi:GT2 family glycosyltransferase
MEKISIVICAYTEKRWDDLLIAVESIQMQTVKPFELILIIDHNPGLYKRVKKELAHATVLENKHARGLSGARNSGIAAAIGDIIAFMDEDAFADPDWLECLLNGYQDPLVLGVGGMILPVWQSGKPAWFPDEFAWVVGCTYRGLSEELAQVRNLIGCNMSFRKDVFAQIGGFRSGIGRVGTLPYGCEETELCIRAGQKFPESRFMYEPLARVYHRVPAERARFGYFRSRCYAEGISKALITVLIGRRDGLSSEFAYTFKTLPKGILKGLQDSIQQREFSGVGRAVSIAVGFGFTALGYLAGRLSILVGHNMPDVSKINEFNPHESFAE